jgi:hypothetical protein
MDGCLCSEGIRFLETLAKEGSLSKKVHDEVLLEAGACAGWQQARG